MNKILCFCIGLTVVFILVIFGEFIVKAFLIILAILAITFIGWLVQILWKFK